MYGGEFAGTDPFFSSPTIHNTSAAGGGTAFGFLAGLNFHSHPLFPSNIVPKAEEMGMLGFMGANGQEEITTIMESGSGSGHMDGLSCGEEQVNQPDKKNHTPPSLAPEQPPPKKKRYHRHTAHQIQEMEALFKECPHPDDKQRMKLSQELGLKPRQVKFWFQNRRTQMKAQQDRADNVILRAENENLKSDNYRLQAAIRNLVCPSCGDAAVLGEISLDEQQLRLENIRLKEELQRLSCIASRYNQRLAAPPMLGLAPPYMLPPPSLDLDMGVYSRNFSEPLMSNCTDIIPAAAQMSESCSISPSFFDAGCIGGGLLTEQDNAVALNLAMTAAEHLVRMCRTNAPLWVAPAAGGGASTELMNFEEHSRLFTWPMDLKNGEYRSEGTRDSAVVIMNSITLVDAFLDANKWMELFPSIVSKARRLQIVSPGVSGHGNGSLHLMYAELQYLSPLVPTRETHFLRYCQQNQEEGTWVIVDFPIDGIQDNLQFPFPRYRRRPSGCLIQDMPNGYSRVTWVEHAEVEEDKPVHGILEQVVNSGMAFGAPYWLSVLQRQCERLASLMARNISDLGVIPTPEARKNMMRLSQRMVKTLCANICYSSGPNSWSTSSVDSIDDTLRLTTRKNTDPGQPNGVILTAVSTTWVPFSHDQVLNLLTDEQRRSQIDVLCNGNSLHEVAHIANGSHPRNSISLLRINAASNSSQNVELLLQESSTHPAGGSLIVFSTVDVDAVQVVMSGEDTSCIPLLPMGFVLFPAPPPSPTIAATDGVAPPLGCLLTICLQVLTSAVPSAKLNVSNITALNGQLRNAVQQITSALSGNVRVGATAPASTVGSEL